MTDNNELAINLEDYFSDVEDSNPEEGGKLPLSINLDDYDFSDVEDSNPEEGEELPLSINLDDYDFSDIEDGEVEECDEGFIQKLNDNGITLFDYTDKKLIRIFKTILD